MTIWHALTQIATQYAMGFYEFEILPGIVSGLPVGYIMRPYNVRPGFWS